jgi:hypothetical protein
MRLFNTSGPNILAEHYTLPRLSLIEKGKDMVHRSQDLSQHHAIYGRQSAVGLLHQKSWFKQGYLLDFFE